MISHSAIRLCVIIPTYNNAGTVKQVIEDVSKHCKEIIVVNDGSTDDTAAILNTMQEAIHVVTYSPNKGKGHALVAGFRKAMEMGFTHAVTIDADGQHFADDMPLLIEEMYRKSDSIIVGCRNLTEENMPRQNTFANRFSNFWFRLQTGINLPDTQSGYRLYALSALKDCDGLRHVTKQNWNFWSFLHGVVPISHQYLSEFTTHQQKKESATSAPSTILYASAY